MKSLIDKIKYALPAAFVLFMLFALLQGCKKEVATQPEITRIRVTDPANANLDLTKAQPGAYIVIEGKNLANAIQVLVNDMPVYFNTALNTGTHIIFQIPANAPTPDRFNVPNTIKVVTHSGSAAYDFTTEPPPPILESIYNYNPKPGTVLEISGKNLFGVNEVVFPGGKLGTGITKNEEGTVLKVTVPTDLDPMVSDYLKINSPFGNVTSKFKVNTIYSQGAFANFDGANEAGCGCWTTVPNSATLDAAMYPNSTGKYVRLMFNATAAIDGGQTAAGRAYNYGGPAKVIIDPAALSQAPEDYYLLFEINTKQPITGGALRVAFGSNWSSYSGPYQYDMLLAKGAPGNAFDTKNQWQTIMMPLTNLVSWSGNDFNWDTNEPKSSATLIPVTTLTQLFKATGAMNGFAVKTLATKTSGGFSAFDAAFDNFRIEKIAK